MSIKFKCGGCNHVLSVPDKLAGKQGKCPKCQTKLKVPSQSAAVAKSASAKKKSAGAAPAAGGTNALDSLLDDAGLVQKSGPVCPNCAADIRPGTVICTGCGMNFETGEKLVGAGAAANEGPEFDNAYLQVASDNMTRDIMMDSRRDKSSMPWWVLMSYLIGALTLCAAGVVIVDGFTGNQSEESTFVGKVQRLPVFTVLGVTAGVTGIAITFFAHLSICVFAFGRNVWQGVACFFLPLVYSVVYGIMNWTDNKAPVKAIISAMVFLGIALFFIYQGGGFAKLQGLF